jgi:DNA-binding MarR family transcriptional regulator
MAGPRAGQPLPAPPARQELLAQVLAEAPRHGASSVRLNVAVAHQLGMAQADLQCMGLLAQGPSAPTRLAAALGLTTGAMTKVLDRLEAAGYIARSHDPADRRRVIITAEAAGLARLAAHYDGIGERIRAYLSGRTNAELEVILAFMRAGEQAVDEELAQIRSRGIRHGTRRPRNAAAPRRRSDNEERTTADDNATAGSDQRRP